MTQAQGETLTAFFRRVGSMRRDHTRPGALLWSYAVNYRVGAVFAVMLLPTAVSPSAVTVAALALHVAGAVYVAFIGPPASWIDVVVVFVIWQTAYSLDCADGQLARARSATSPFGAWLDQIGDFIGHASMYTALVIFISRSVSVGAPTAAAVAGFIVGGSLLELFASSQRNSIMGTAPAASASAPSRLLRIALLGRHVTDYGAWLLAASVLLLSPRALLVGLLSFAALSVASVAGQVAVNWRGA